jgi:hypothetical protein
MMVTVTSNEKGFNFFLLFMLVEKSSSRDKIREHYLRFNSRSCYFDVENKKKIKYIYVGSIKMLTLMGFRLSIK